MTLDTATQLELNLRSLMGEIEDKATRIQATYKQVENSEFDLKLQKLNAETRQLEDARDTLNLEFSSLNSMAESRARLDIKRKDFSRKDSEITSTLDSASAKYRKLVGEDLSVMGKEGMEREVERVNGEKEKELQEVESRKVGKDRDCQQSEALVKSLKGQVKAKHEEVKSMSCLLGYCFALES